MAKDGISGFGGNSLLFYDMKKEYYQIGIWVLGLALIFSGGLIDSFITNQPNFGGVLEGMTYGNIFSGIMFFINVFAIPGYILHKLYKQKPRKK